MRRLRDAFDAELVGYEAMNAASLALVQRHFAALRAPLPLADAAGAPLWSVLIDWRRRTTRRRCASAPRRRWRPPSTAGEAVTSPSPPTSCRRACCGSCARHPARPRRRGPEHQARHRGAAVRAGRLRRRGRRRARGLVPGARHITFGHLGDGNLHYNLQAPEGDDAAGFLAATRPRSTRASTTSSTAWAARSRPSTASGGSGAPSWQRESLRRRWQ